MRGDEYIINILRDKRGQVPPTKLALMLDELTDSGVSQGSVLMFFKRAFSEIPLKTLIDAGGWHRISSGDLTDDDFDNLLAPWLRCE